MQNMPESPQILPPSVTGAAAPHPKGCHCPLCMGTLRAADYVEIFHPADLYAVMPNPFDPNFVDPQKRSTVIVEHFNRQVRAALLRGVSLGIDHLQSSFLSQLRVHSGIADDATRIEHRSLLAFLGDGRFGKVIGTGEMCFYVTPFFLVRDVLDAVIKSREVLLA